MMDIITRTQRNLKLFLFWKKVKKAVHDLLIITATCVIVGGGTYMYTTYLQDHGCVIGTTCISITR
ncbi:hypothetical protein RsoM2USA_76 [Ralstonia phage RsoM2USA]|nr:hypothetical protein RsoM2USA_76 [Ralstonia phage RsoM2USA]